MDSTCPNCGQPQGDNTTGNFTNFAPDAPKPTLPQPGTNVRLNSDNAQIVFNSRTKAFTVREAQLEREKSEMDEDRERRKRFPDLPEIPDVDQEFKSKEFKALRIPGLSSKPQNVDPLHIKHVQDLQRCMNDLAIDG